MTFRQKMMKKLYNIIMLKGKIFPTTNTIYFNNNLTEPKVSFYSLDVTLNNNDKLNLEQYKGKKIIVVNTASNCGYTAQFAELETLYKQHADKLVVLGFPSNDFRNQDAGTDAEIIQFCTVNYGVTFQIMKKSTVLKVDKQNEVYKWLSFSEKNGWCDQAPTWNFCKYLINEKGVLTHFFSKEISPNDSQFLNAIFDK